MKLLLFRATPRDNIPDVMAENKSLLQYCDMLEVKFAFEFDAYKYARDYFLNHDYDYLVLATDDIIVKKEHIKAIRDNVTHRLNRDGTSYFSLDGSENLPIFLIL